MSFEFGEKHPRVCGRRLRAVHARFRRLGARGFLHRRRALLISGYGAAIAGSWTPADAAASEELRNR